MIPGTKKPSAANRGKASEDVFKKWAKAKSDSTFDFAFYRYPDAHAGSLVSAPADFMIMHKGLMSLIEIKEINHEFRLPVKNFRPDQVARMRKFALAGAGGLVLIYFKPVGKWRAVPVDYFLNPEGASWNLWDFDLLDFPAVVSKVLRE